MWKSRSFSVAVFAFINFFKSNQRESEQHKAILILRSQYIVWHFVCIELCEYEAYIVQYQAVN